ncbi:pyrroline-5-carboxylate reductase [Bartonella sp. HY038]|uniref:pyrroline-5-carboxylate reductase n=1 Tax=Bartonella sp. HY038 TaxID=2759660 RepID=UPI0015FCF188|nr:pyrroline-5-carboxylate reductase [Bartonella sp. HY038]
MNIGFLGTGTISDAIIRGLAKSDITKSSLDKSKGAVKSIIVSPRSQSISARLATDFPNLVHVACDNQAVVDQSDIVFIALRVQDAQDLLKQLAFKPQQKLVSFIATASIDDLAAWSGHKGDILRAVPLPFVMDHQSATPVFPKDEDVEGIFAKIGGALSLANEEELKIFMIAGSLMGSYYRFAGSANQWLIDHGINENISTKFISKLFASLAHEAQSRPKIDYKELEIDHSTKGGTNELVTKVFNDNGGIDALIKGLDSALEKMQ